MLAGAGVIDGNVTNQGTVTPGTPGDLGSLTINGNYTQGPSGQLTIDVGSPEDFDQLIVNGTADLAGRQVAYAVTGTGPYLLVVPGWLSHLELGWAIPAYVAGPLLMVLLITVLPGSAVPYGWGGVFDAKIILPLIVLSFQPIALIVRQTRAAVIEVLSEDFVRTARAKGLPETVVAFRHVLRPVLTPIVTQLGLIMISIINGAIFVELVFGLPGLGRLTVGALTSSDYPIVLAITIIGSFLVMASNLLVDVLYPILDPRASDARSTR